MLTKTRSSPAPGVIPDKATGPVSNGSPVASDPDLAAAQTSPATAILGWLLGLAATAAFHWRTREPRRGGTTS